ncbi:hypothetical protein BGZ98_007570 [Dissophora globulifera]|nr:hypothetical protein BGZ98_007570 [Dissophora globulifera]
MNNTLESTPSLPLPHQPRPQNALLIPELAFLIGEHLLQHDLAAASRVCKNWHDIWTPFLYHTVRYDHQYTRNSHSSYNHNTPTPQSTSLAQPSGGSSSLSSPAGITAKRPPPFLNLERYGHWIKVLELSNLIVAPCNTTADTTVAAVTAPSAPSNSATMPASVLNPAQDHLVLLQSCRSLDLTQLHISRTVMTLERLDELLSALPTLKVFKFEVINTNGIINKATDLPSPAVSWNSRSRTYSGSSSLLKKPHRSNLEGLEQEVIRTIAKRLSSHLERLELLFTVKGTITTSAIEELLTSCGVTLKALSLTRADICRSSNSREWNTFFQHDIDALLERLSGTVISTPTATATSSSSLASSSATTAVHSTAASSPATLSTSSSLSSLASFSTPTSSSTSHSFSTVHLASKRTLPALESLQLHHCAIEDRECTWLLRRAPALKELCLHDCRKLDGQFVRSIHTYTPLLDTISLSSVPLLNAERLHELFQHPEPQAIKSTATGAESLKSVNFESDMPRLQLKKVRLAYLRQLDNTITKTLTSNHGTSLTKLSLQWCPHVTDDGIISIFQSCTQLQDLNLCLSKATPNIFKDLAPVSSSHSQPAGQVTQTMMATQQRRPWACAQTLERLEINSLMFVDRVRISNDHLQPQLYHHMSHNPHLRTRNRSNSYGALGNASSSNPSIGGPSINGASNSINNESYSLAHHQGYPMYHLWRYSQYSDPFQEFRAQLEMLPRLRHLGIPAKGIEHLIKKGFNGPTTASKIQIQSLSLLNQQGRVWSPEEVAELLSNMPGLRSLYCEKNTLLLTSSAKTSVSVGASGYCNGTNNSKWRKDCSSGGVALQQREEVQRLLQQHCVELLPHTSPTW